MKGLMIKDLLIMRNQKSSLLLILGMGIAMSFYMEASTMIGYLMMLGSLMALSTMSYDEYENGHRYLLTMPVTRKEYVKQKYLFCIMWIAASMIIGFAGSALIMVIKKQFEITDVASTILVMYFMISLLIAVSIPARLKYGSEKSRIITYVFFGGISLVAVLISRFVPEETAYSFMDFLNTNSVVVITALIVISILLTILSYLISVRIMVKKEF